MPPAFASLTREEWAALAPAKLPSTAGAPLGGICPPLEVASIYAPLSHLLGARAADPRRAVGGPYLIGIAGGVAVGKTTAAQVLQALLAGGPSRSTVEVVATDGFLYTNAELDRRGLATRKGCPESYDVAHLVRFLGEVRSGRPRLSVPVYSHETYDVAADEVRRFARPDLLIVEGVNVLDTTCGGPPFAADLLDFSIYVDADEQDIERWFVKRFVGLCEQAKGEGNSFYRRFAALSTDQIEHLARRVWRDVNGFNLRQSVAPTRSRADLVLEKGPDHAVRRVWMRER